MVLLFLMNLCLLSSDHFKNETVCACSGVNGGGNLISKRVQQNFNQSFNRRPSFITAGQVVHLVPSAI